MSNNIEQKNIIEEIQKEFDDEIKKFEEQKFETVLNTWKNLYHDQQLSLDEYTNPDGNAAKNLAKFLLYDSDSKKFFGSANPSGNNDRTMLYKNRDGKTYNIEDALTYEKNRNASHEDAEGYYNAYIQPLISKMDKVKTYKEFVDLENDEKYRQHKHNIMLRKIVVINSLWEDKDSDLYCNLIPLYSEECLKNICGYLDVKYINKESLIEPMKKIVDWCVDNLKIEKSPKNIVVLGRVLYNIHIVNRVVYLPYDCNKKDSKIKINNGICEYKTENSPRDLKDNDKVVYVLDKQKKIVYQGKIDKIDKNDKKTHNVVYVKLKKKSENVDRFKEIIGPENGWTEKNIYNIKCYKELEMFFDQCGDIADSNGIDIQDDAVVISESEYSDNALKTKMGSTSIFAYNKIFYGVPGCGKSYHIEHEVLDGIFANYPNCKASNTFRTIFYQDYSHADFVGQYMPKRENGVVEYKFIPKVFTKALARAYQKPNEPVVLIIEEINRGDAASIFGDIFQLLDRDNDGRSEYEIDCDEILDYLSTIEDKGGTIKSVVETNKIYIPSNLYLLATMNTCDQNVFALDTAFKRRWNMEEIPNEFNDHKIKDMLVPYDFGGMPITWEKFVQVVNEQIVENSDEFFGDDRQIGCFFVDDTCLGDPKSANKDAAKNFAYKVISYLWNDVAKLNRTEWFDDKVKTLHDAIVGFKNNGDVFASDLYNNLKN